MRAPATSPDDLARLARWLTVETPELRPHIPDAVALAESVASAPFWADARAHGDVHVEVPFTRVASSADRERLGIERAGAPVIVRGVIDLVHRAGDGWRVVDYKTDQDRAQNLAAKYAAQVTVYAGGLGRGLGRVGHRRRDGGNLRGARRRADRRSAGVGAAPQSRPDGRARNTPRRAARGCGPYTLQAFCRAGRMFLSAVRWCVLPGDAYHAHWADACSHAPQRDPTRFRPGGRPWTHGCAHTSRRRGP